MTAFRPSPEGMLDQMVQFSEGPFGGAVPVIVPPSPDFRVEIAYDLHCRTLLMLIQKGFASSVMSERLFLLRLRQQCPLEPPHLDPEDVEPFCALHDTSFGFAEVQSPVGEKCL
jgi:hypothetical protein